MGQRQFFPAGFHTTDNPNRIRMVNQLASPRWGERQGEGLPERTFDDVILRVKDQKTQKLSGVLIIIVPIYLT